VSGPPVGPGPLSEEEDPLQDPEPGVVGHEPCGSGDHPEGLQPSLDFLEKRERKWLLLMMCLLFHVCSFCSNARFLYNVVRLIYCVCACVCVFEKAKKTQMGKRQSETSLQAGLWSGIAEDARFDVNFNVTSPLSQQQQL